MKITSAPQRAADTSRRHVKAAVLAVVGLAALLWAWSMSWVAVRPGQAVVDRLLGNRPSTEVRTFALADLAGYWQPLCVGWGALLVLLVVAWLRPPWRFGLRLAAMLLGVVLAVGTFLPGTAAIDVSGFPLKDNPGTELLGGVWLGLLGVVLLTRAVTTLPELSTPAAPEVPPAPPAVPADEPIATDPQTAPDSTPFVWQGSRRDARSAAPWWRRPGPIVGVLAVLGVATILGVVTWRAIHSADEQPAALGALVVVAPADSAPTAPAAADDRVDLGRILPLSPDRANLLAEQTGDDVVHVAGTAWTRPDDAAVSITLVQFSSSASADQFQRSYSDLRQATPGEATPLADVPGAAVFVGAERAGVWAVAGRADVVVIVSVVGGPSETVPVAESLLREQYDRL
ncbi:hypothetical protein [Micromonospora parathelypteridis]|uniref:Uncharacterized protein n=1 Tax=Micromonospora parathelypteridis TaxID=1839617 RepID=A0A840W4L6_9ACTN|nr:hypothetical protein [Micromonospora parathelypteridis]MBB5478081.1 hypothetical protein [Micromonospora parathelypteridis]GGO13299.1 hypothetical protein GCM10011576_23240 [Micromonospora parathelypteridis]